MVSVKKLLQEQMPGWDIAEPNHSIEDTVFDSSPNAAHRGVTLEELQRKFGGSHDNAVDNAPDGMFKGESKIKVIKVKPKGGGDSKVADIIDGKISIVQG